jgi:hypothetical protein
VNVPPPRVFAERVRICLIIKELTFLGATKSLQEYQTMALRPEEGAGVGEASSR